ncbi:hypothetical protein ABT247_23745 [Kitasatospora sp. NPDC001539]|uniref:hypothetical protein n=1 Tax=Kitasatospora sp. NPDC001539 TaxID=3154384 RepID=UPI00331A82E3
MAAPTTCDRSATGDGPAHASNPAGADNPATAADPAHQDGAALGRQGSGGLRAGAADRAGGLSAAAFEPTGEGVPDHDLRNHLTASEENL